MLLACEEWARERGLPVLAYFTQAQTAAVDHVHTVPGTSRREGLLMAPAYAMPRMLDRAGLALGDFDLYEIHEAFAAQVLCTLRAWEDPVFCRERLGREQPLGAIDRERLNVNGGSLAAGHPFAATGGRIVAALAKALHERGAARRGVVSVCAAAGQGVVAVLEADPEPADPTRGAGERMSDRYAQLVNSRPGGLLARRAGLPRPVALERHRPGDPVIRGRVLLGGAPGGRLLGSLAGVLGQAGCELATMLDERLRAIVAGAGLDATVFNADAPGEQRFKALVFDATGIADSTELVALHAFFHGTVRRVEPCGRVIVLGTEPADCGSVRESTAQRALEGFTRSLGKEIGRGATVQLVLVAGGAEEQLASTLRFLLSPRSAYVSGQVVHLRHAHAPAEPEQLDWERPLNGRTALVTGASRGIGEAIATTLAREGAHVVGLDVPGAAAELQRVSARLGGEALELDVTAPDTPGVLAERFAGGLDVVVHNAGVTRDRTLAKDARRALERADGDQPLQPGADRRRAAGGGRRERARPHRVRVLDERDRGQCRPDQLRDLQGGRDRQGPGARPRAGRARRDHQRGRTGVHRDADDRPHADRHPGSRQAHEQPLAGWTADRRGGDDRLAGASRLGRGQRQRRPRVRPEPPGGVMATRELDTPPRILELYARALAPLVPGASRLPWVAGGGEEIPDLALSLAHVRADPARVASYRRVCAFPPGSELPATYPHVLAFPLHLALMADGDFPFAPVGLVHLANHIAQQRPIMLAERFDLRVWATPLEAHPADGRSRSCPRRVSRMSSCGAS